MINPNTTTRFTPQVKQRADIDMGLFDYEKINTIAQIMSTQMIRIRMYDHKALKLASAYLKEFFSLMRPIIIKHGEIGREQIDKEFNRIKTKIDWIYLQNRIPYGKNYYQLFDEFEELYLLILDIKQKIGLGMRASVAISQESNFAKRYGGK